MNKNQISKMALMGLASGLLMSAQGVASEVREDSANAQNLAAAGCGNKGSSNGYKTAGAGCGQQNRSRGYVADTYYNGYNSTAACSAQNPSRGYTSDANYSDTYNTNAWQTRGDNSYRSGGPEYRIEVQDNTPYRGNSSYYDQQQGYYSNDPYSTQSSYDTQYRGYDNFGGGREMNYYDNNQQLNQNQFRSDTTVARLLPEKDLIAQLNEQGKDQYSKLDEQGKLLARKLAAQPGYTDKNKAVRDAFQIRTNATNSTNSNINSTNSNINR